MNQHFRIECVKASGPARLALSFADGYIADVDLSGLIDKHPSLARLRDPGVFSRVTPDEWQLGVIFDNDDDLALAGDNLRALALEQAG